jgi:hypothetical protein
MEQGVEVKHYQSDKFLHTKFGLNLYQKQQTAHSLSSGIFFLFDFTSQFMLSARLFSVYSMLSCRIGRNFLAAAVVLLLPDEGDYFPHCSCASW